MNSTAEKLRLIKLLILDVDGVLTDGRIIIHSDGSESKNFHVVDGHRIRMWGRAGYKTAILSGRTSGATAVRAEQLQIDSVRQGCIEKLPAYLELLRENNLTDENVAYIGDDLMDIPPVRRAALGVAVATACDELKNHADYITRTLPGQGAVAEVIEYILKTTDCWQPLMQRYLV